MKVMIVDDEKLALQQFLLETEDMPAVEVAAAFSDPQEALDYMKEADAKDSVEAAFLDIEMPGMNGLILAEKLREIKPDLVVIFITGYEQYAFDAMKIKADYYMTKPYDRNDIEEVMERARLLARRQRKRVYFRTFGRFDMFVDGETVSFANTKAKELLALCVDRKGGSVTIEEAVDKLWEGRAYDNRVKNLYRKAVMYLRQLLGELGVEEIFHGNRGSCNIDLLKVDCDYYELLKGNPEAVRVWEMTGNYLQEYSWAEETAVRLEMSGGKVTVW